MQLALFDIDEEQVEVGNCRWSTPRDLFGVLDVEFGFTLDACAEEWNAKCENYFSPDDDGLSKPWSGVVWMNPPYGLEIEKWIRKAYEESKRGCIVVCLVPARTETDWFHDYCLKGEVRFLRGRLHFTDHLGRSGRPRFGSAIVIFWP
jgi:phage N-6-adenine-methyltransferase